MSSFGVAVSPTKGASKYVKIFLYLLYIDLCASSHITRSKCPHVNIFLSSSLAESMQFIIV